MGWADTGCTCDNLWLDQSTTGSAREEGIMEGRGSDNERVHDDGRRS
jgi:hypothetical protein